MPMDVVVIRHVRMDMVQRLVSMPMTVGPEGHLVVLMQMVTIVVAMGVLVLKRFVLVRVRMLFGDEKHDTAHHQRRTGQHPDAAAALAEQESQQRSDERGERKYRAGARDTEGSLRQQGVSWYQSQARVAVDTASSVSIGDALAPLVCGSPRPSAPGRRPRRRASSARAVVHERAASVAY